MIHENTKSMRRGCRHSLGKACSYPVTLLLYHLVPLEGGFPYSRSGKTHATQKTQHKPKEARREIGFRERIALATRYKSPGRLLEDRPRGLRSGHRTLENHSYLVYQTKIHSH